MHHHHHHHAAGADDPVGQLAEQLTRTFRRLRAGSARELAPLGLTFAQARVLRVIGHASEPMRIGDVAGRLEIVPRSATGIVDALEEAGLVERRRDTADRRSVFVTPTQAGRDLLARMGEARRENAERLFGRLTAEQRATLLELLVAINESADDDPAKRDVR